MTSKKEETASFMVRFTQKIFEDDQGEPQVQWRGNIRHVQGGQEKRFSNFEDVTEFIQQRLADLTVQAMQDKSPEEQKGILSKSFDMWKKMASATPKMVLDTIKDPKKQVSQIKDQINQVGESIGQKLELDNWLAGSKSDLKDVVQMIKGLSDNINRLNDKVDELNQKK